MKTLILIFITTTAWAQHGREFPRWQEQAIVLDLIRGRECDSSYQHMLRINAELRAEITQWQGVEVQLQSVVFNYEHNIVPQLNTELDNQHLQTIAEAQRAKKYRAQRNLVVLIVVVVEALRIVGGHP